jgi:hypothetical protein
MCLAGRLCLREVIFICAEGTFSDETSGREVGAELDAGVNVLGPYRARDGGGKRFSRASILSASDGHLLIVWAYKNGLAGVGYLNRFSPFEILQ